MEAMTACSYAIEDIVMSTSIRRYEYGQAEIMLDLIL